MKAVTFAAAGVLLASASASAQAATIDFDELTHTGYYTAVNPVDSGGFHFSNDGSGASALGVWGANESGNMDPGGAALFNNRIGSTTTVTLIGGGTFDFYAIDLADVYNDGTGGNVLFTFSDGMGTTAQTVTLDSMVGGQTFSFNRTGLSSFTMQGVTTTSQVLQFDNVVVNNAIGAIPEPSAWALMILGFGLVGGAMRRSPTVRLSLRHV